MSGPKLDTSELSARLESELAELEPEEAEAFLREMGVDSQVWVYAMETPKDELFYFKPDEFHATMTLVWIVMGLGLAAARLAANGEESAG